MAVLPFQPTPFFANKNRAFWNLQFAGWGGALLLRAMSALANRADFDFLIVIIIASAMGLSISLVLSVIYRQLINRRPLITWTMTTLVLAIAVSLYAFMDVWVIELYYPDREGGFAQRFLGVFYLDLTLLGAWSALYYAINFFLQVEEQADRLERLEAQATSAQLAMLRYQLNPHFLFNTLNSISTLVLLKQTEPANAMLTRLSSFLRHTLMVEASGQVTLAQEVETLKLYLGIERMRFEDRLRTDFKIEPAAAKACLPAMLLQPLVENAIKYAVSPQEEGARITLSAEIIGRRLRVTVADTGPGMPAGQTKDELGARTLPDAITGYRQAVSTGVGLANIRDRLAQAYGEEHLFEIRSPPTGGFTVVIELPFEESQEELFQQPFRNPGATTEAAQDNTPSENSEVTQTRQIGRQT
ncbi:MAG: histidine kinase [Pontixanthobacter sp.]